MFDGWEHPDPAAIRVLESDSDWSQLEQRYGQGARPFHRCMQVARLNGARTVVIETRYIDLDYRSEYSAYYSRAFASSPDSAVRLHFFGTRFDGDAVANLPDDPH